MKPDGLKAGLALLLMIGILTSLIWVGAAGCGTPCPACIPSGRICIHLTELGTEPGEHWLRFEVYFHDEDRDQYPPLALGVFCIMAEPASGCAREPGDREQERMFSGGQLYDIYAYIDCDWSGDESPGDLVHCLLNVSWGQHFVSYDDFASLPVQESQL